MKLCLALHEYKSHLTDEGNQIQLGLQHNGWTLCGAGFGDGCRDVAQLLDRHNPEAVFVNDARDWVASSPGAFNKNVAFTNTQELASRKDIVRLSVCKDAGTAQRFQREFAEHIGADGMVIYYHPRSVLAVSPWLQSYPLIRTYHSVDADFCNTLAMSRQRKRGLVSGAQNPTVYPLRNFVTKHARALDIDVLPHAGYGNRGCRTPEYLRTLAQYKVHVATASSYGFALRKLIESVAVGATPVTDLPSYDQLPGIDSALIRIPSGAGFFHVKEAIDFAENSWNFDQRMEYARIARELYDWRVIGKALDTKIAALKVAA